MNDLRLALRSLRANPGFTAAAVLTLALGIGANAAMVGLAAAALFRAPAVRQPGRLVAVYTTCRRGAPRCSSSYPDYLDYRDRSRTLTGLTAYTWTRASLGDEQGARLVTVQLVTGNYFTLLGVGRGLGRLITPADDRRGDARQVAVLSQELWRDQFGGDSGIVGRTVRLNGATFRVIGIVPPRFHGLHLGAGPDLYIPFLSGFALGAGFEDDRGRLDDRGSRWIAQLVGRMAPGVTLPQVRADMLSISRALASEDPQARGPRSITVDPISTYILPPGARSDLPHFVLLLVGVVGAALLLACANLANLLLSRAAARRREIGMRLALGARRGRLVRQLLTESLTLAALGGLAGVLVASWALSLLSRFSLPGGVRIGDLKVGLDASTVAIAALLSVLTGVLFGGLPALQASNPALVGALRGDPLATRGGAWTRRGLIAVQIALSFVLLVGSGLFLRTLANGLAFDPGFRPEHVALARFDLALQHYTPQRSETFTRQLVERITRAPGVESASLGSVLPFEQGGFTGTFVRVAGYQPAPDEEMRVDYVLAAPAYFRTLGIPILAGRGILVGDGRGGPQVAVVSEAAARRWWPDGDAVGGRLTIGGLDREVVGVVGDAQWRQLGETATPYVFIPLRQAPQLAAAVPLTLVVRTSRNPATMLPVIRTEVAGLDRDVSLSAVQTMDDRFRHVLMPQRMGALLLTLFALLALVLATVGIYGVVSFNVSRERRAIGIRVALGARRGQVVSMIARGMIVPVASGLVGGLVAALALTRAVRGFLFQVGTRDPLTYAALAVLLAGVATLAVLVPAGRATRIHPMEALRAE